ncbi:cysteine desulfurase family protein [Lacicoccus alkaliphilus]|uniref:Cysteine desulfurase n=1 Tax=Lacicoccus alkaliphilus DSM 16010 TaxID=1123231 RepID=A0A1M7JRD4_9BACL|nr:aminotransferase class V-fold PLP-dependent enzyme [Salinicoccus alkaliphilus]SHM55629.1 cysteine desulfurase [Salinicoccus alkaliphilus DSM 16010]
MIYFDNASTTQASKAVLNNYLEMSEKMYFNSESIHGGGLDTAFILDNVRNYIREYFNTDKHVIFTRSGSHSNDIALQLLLKNKTANKILVSPYEHMSISASLHPYTALYDIVHMPTKSNGEIDLESLEEMMADTQCIISTHVHSETGYRLPVEGIAEIAGSYHVPYHIDGVQGMYDHLSTGGLCTSYSFSAHKIHGVKGVGVLLMDYEHLTPLNPHFHHEYGTQNGTLDVPGIATLIQALEAIDDPRAMRDMRHHLNTSLSALGLRALDLNHHADHISSFIVPGMEGQYLMQSLSSRNIYISTGSACGHGVLVSRGLGNLIAENYGASADQYIRISLSRYNSMEEVQQLIECVEKIVKEE